MLESKVEQQVKEIKELNIRLDEKENIIDELKRGTDEKEEDKNEDKMIMEAHKVILVATSPNEALKLKLNENKIQKENNKTDYLSISKDKDDKKSYQNFQTPLTSPQAQPTPHTTISHPHSPKINTNSHTKQNTNPIHIPYPKSNHRPNTNIKSESKDNENKEIETIINQYKCDHCGYMTNWLTNLKAHKAAGRCRKHRRGKIQK